MRSVNKGNPPRSYTRYQDAQTDLINSVGDYCSYCERQIETNLAVEHIQPKSNVANLRNEWSNFLLSCCNCNSCKGSIPVNVDDYFWPDIDNTLLVLDYIADGIIVAHPELTTSDIAKATLTIELFGLDKYPGHPNRRKRPTSKDIRWRRRQEVWELAHRQRQRIQQDSTNLTLRELVVDVATGRGLFSIWMKVFEDDADMRQRFIQAFPGTAIDCFDANCKAIKRPRSST